MWMKGKSMLPSSGYVGMNHYVSQYEVSSKIKMYLLY